VAAVSGILVIAGMLSLVASAIPAIPIRVNPHATWMLIFTGSAGMVLAFQIPRLSILFEGHVQQYALLYVGGISIIAAWTGSLYATRKWTWTSAYALGFERGKDDSTLESKKPTDATDQSA